TGAGADRMQTGMQLAYGKSAGKAAILKSGSKIFFVAVINLNSHPRQIYEEIFSSMIKKALVLIEGGVFEEAYHHYKNSVLTLKQRFGVK
ncbi:unnamed protein product, partial [marine sediment metagenome]